MKEILKIIYKKENNLDCEFLSNYNNPFDFYKKQYKPNFEIKISKDEENFDIYKLHSSFIKKSEYLYNIYLLQFNNTFKKSETIKIPYYNKELFEILLEFLYNGNNKIFNDFKKDLLIKIIIIADYLAIDNIDKIIDFNKIFDSSIDMSLEYNISQVYLYTSYTNINLKYTKEESLYSILFFNFITNLLIYKKSHLDTLFNYIKRMDKINTENYLVTLKKYFDNIRQMEENNSHDKGIILNCRFEIVKIFNIINNEYLNSITNEKRILDIEMISIFEPYFQKIFDNAKSIHDFVKNEIKN